MNKLFRIIAGIALVAGLTACGTRVEVPSAHVGKVQTRAGYQEGTIPTSRFRLDPCWAYCDNLVLLDVSDRAVMNNLTVFMPEDRLNLDVGVQVTLSIDTAEIDPLFDSLRPEGDSGDRVRLIPWEAIYRTYAEQVILTETREFISQYSIGEVASSLERMNSDLRARLEARITERTPFRVRYAGIVSVTYPDIITNAQQQAAERRERIQQEEAQLQISRVELERELEEARLQRQIDVERAEAEAHAQRIQREAVDARVLELRRLENQKLFLERWDGKLPVYMMGGDASANLLFQVPPRE